MIHSLSENENKHKISFKLMNFEDFVATKTSIYKIIINKDVLNNK